MKTRFRHKINRLLFAPILLSVWLFLVTTVLGAPPDGKYVETFPGGKVKVTGYYRAGNKDKRWMYYDENGHLLTKEKWKAGMLQWKAEYENGRIARTIDHEGKVTEKPKCGCN